MKGFAIASWVCLALGLTGGAVAQSIGGPSAIKLPPPQVPAPQVAPAPKGGVGLTIADGKYALALATAEAALQKDPGNLDQMTVKILALLGLGRGMEALRMAVPLAGQHPERPQIRYLAGKAAFDQGMIPQAVQVWSALYSCPDAEWAVRAYRASAQAQLSIGKEAEARKLIEEALSRWPATTQTLARLALEVAPGTAGASQIIGKVIASNPTNKDDWEALGQMVASASGDLFEEASAGDKPLVIPIKEKSERVNIPTFMEGDKYATNVTLSSGSRVTVPVSVGGKKQWMLLDSGANLVLLTSNYARELGLKPVATAEYLGLGYEGAKKSNWVMIPLIKVGDLEFKNVPAMIIDKDSDFWKELGGILPLSMFRHHAVLYDRRHEKLTLYSPGTKAEAVMGDKLYPQKSLWFYGKPFVMAQINDRQNLPCLMDTGADSTYIAAEFAQDLGIAVNTGKYKSEYSRGLSGGFLSGTADQVDMQLGGARFPLKQVMVTELGQGYPIPCYGLIGRNIIDNFMVFFDYASNALVLKAYDR